MKKIISLGIILGGILMFSFAGAGGVVTDTDNSNGFLGRGNTTTNVCSNSSMHNVTGIINWASCLLIKAIVPFLFSLATVAFIWGVIQFYLNPENEEKRKKGKSFIIGGLIALFVMLSMWGIVAVITETFDLPNIMPQFPGQ